MMPAAFHFSIALILLGLGIYAALAGAVAMVVGVDARVSIRTTRIVGAATIVIGLSIYLAGNLLLVAALFGDPV
ncbi:hypothetical protein EAH84_03320 [Sphingomonas oligophenolica]|uniref:Uncharacterized protein n=2 Tax=Sphingomonas oligophenolica TaxID=301154 RepID=A0A502CRL2_9SPHN|nr:hypothetical protein EAH84_03320 [Sphingomonas oligophenolica]